jgi:hypothetical protein
VNADDDDDIDSFNVAGTWYICDNLGFGTGYRRFDNFGIEANEFSAHGEWFVSEQVGLSLAFSHTEVDDTDNNDTDVDVDSIVLGARLCF